jgi:hypothetical protein
MKKVKLIIAAAMTLLAFSANAAFVDNRSPAAGGEITVAYKAISVDDLLGEIVPQGYAIEYMSPEIPRKKIDLNGKGTWEALVSRAAAAAHVKVEVLGDEKVVRLKALQTVASSSSMDGNANVRLSSQPQEHKNSTPDSHSVEGLAVPGEQAALPLSQSWSLQPGHTIGQDLQLWATKAGWKVIWNMSKDWAVPAPTTFSGTFQTAAGKVIETLAVNGAFIHAQFFTGNNTMVVTGSGVTTH